MKGDGAEGEGSCMVSFEDKAQSSNRCEGLLKRLKKKLSTRRQRGFSAVFYLEYILDKKGRQLNGTRSLKEEKTGKYGNCLKYNWMCPSKRFDSLSYQISRVSSPWQAIQGSAEAYNTRRHM